MTTPNQRIFLSPPHLSGREIAFVKEAFASNFIAPLGPQVDAFEKEFSEYTGIAHCVALCSGTAAMHLALRWMIEQARAQQAAAFASARPLVLASTLTFIGSVSPAVFEGCDVVFIDSDRASWNMDPTLLAETLAACAARGRRPVAIIPTDLYGQCCDYDQIYALGRQYGVPVILDAAEAMGARCQGQHAGHGADAAVFSFNGNKIITTSGGGLLASPNQALIDKARFWSQQAREPFAHYEHTEIGYNYRMSNILAAIGRGQLRVLEDRVRRKREIFEYYRSALKDVPGIEFMPEPDWSMANRWLTVILITPEKFGADREDVRLALEAENIESRPVWKPMHLQPVFDVSHKTAKLQRTGKKKRYPARMVGGCVAEDLFERGLCLPSGTAMANADLDRVIENILKCGR